MSLTTFLRAHKTDIRLVFEILDAVFFMALPVIVAIGGYFNGETTRSQAIYMAITVFVSTFRLWFKRSPLTRRLGAESTTLDLPPTK